jgi:hypothetical protein
LGPIDCVFANKFIKTLNGKEDTTTVGVQAAQHVDQGEPSKTNIFKTGKELLYGGQGKFNSNSNLTLNNETIRDNGDVTTTVPALTGLKGLEPPRLEDTNREVTGEDKGRLRKQNKHCKRRQKATQQHGTQWTEHTGMVAYNSTPLPRTREPHRNFMCPTGRALNHPAAKLLWDWAMFGCPTRTGRQWTKEEMWEAVERGPHRLAESPEALEHFAEETKEKLRTKQARLIAWDDIKDNPPPQLKISPIAAIPHKSKAFRSILDLFSVYASKMEGSWQRSTTQPLRVYQEGPLINLVNAFRKSYMRLLKRMRMRRYLWQNGT